MRRPLIPGALALVLAAVGCAALAALVASALAATLPATPAWTCGPEASPLVCYAEGLEAWPVVTVEGGRGGLSNCVDDGSGVTWRCVVWAEGDWRRVEADGVTVAARRWEVWLPEVASGP